MVWHIDHTDPRYVFVDISTRLSSIQVWREAAILDPKAMAWAQVVSVHELKAVHEHGDDAVATLRMTLAEFDNTLTGMDGDPEHLLGAIEAFLDFIADDILAEAEKVETVQSIPLLGERDAATLDVVCWSREQASLIKTACEDWPEAYLGVEIYRLSAAHDDVWLAVGLPAEAYARVMERMDEMDESFGRSLFSVLKDIGQAEEAKRIIEPPECGAAIYALDDEIPF